MKWQSCWLAIFRYSDLLAMTDSRLVIRNKINELLNDVGKTVYCNLKHE